MQLKIRKRVVFYLILFDILLFITFILFSFEISLPQRSEEQVLKTVYVTGAIAMPGTYKFSRDITIADVIRYAGGMEKNADLAYVSESLNLADSVTDKQHLHIPYVVEESLNSGSLVSLNNSSKAELDSLPGIGPATAEKIIAARPYSSVEQLKDIAGIGDSKYQEIMSLVEL